MAPSTLQLENPPLLVRLCPVITMTEEQFFEFCRINRDLRIERTAKGDLELMAPTGGGSGDRNAVLTYLLTGWALQDSTGRVFDSSTGFTLPNGATRSPDASWVRGERLVVLTPEQRERFLPLCPDFVVELRSPSDGLASLQRKMQEYIENGALLGWLLDVPNRRVHVYRPGAQVELLEDPPRLSGEPELPGFVLDLRMVWGTRP